MKRLINILTILLSIIACIVIICTFLTSYQFLYLGEIFNSYYAIQVTVAITMLSLAARFWINESGKNKYIYSGLSLILSVFIIAFMLGTVR